ncbi:cyclic pyranopterin monophosphate synthase MoaC [Parvularcula sp. LCG005]|uniref:cyclic pyranopterin monophosphate synthase MoaC n=1 Tax=Parvularcula sp. LCG005 TaxID=3078805 RepID=UPI0029438FEB|nr:cyclic pyranopterin monophosphate synthase MoaC [Parvularcula sp. LCG005]WOI52209.1 cyclic pyranopterin monophosphate synthase MoaC [Parvularcula sp. LCG005]
MSKLTHIGPDGTPRMVDIAGKAVTSRVAVAEGLLQTRSETIDLIRQGTKKGDVISVATLAGIMGAKRTADLIPLCHPLPLSGVDVEIEIDENIPGLRVTATVRTDGKTGVEMEALIAVTVACLTLYDMLKAADRGMVITAVRLLRKSGGASGDWVAEGGVE